MRAAVEEKDGCELLLHMLNECLKKTGRLKANAIDEIYFNFYIVIFLLYWTKKIPFIQSAAFWYHTWCLFKWNNEIYTCTCLRLAFLDTSCILHYLISQKSCILNNSARIRRISLLQVETVHMWWPIERDNSLKNCVQKLLPPEDPLKTYRDMFLGFCLNIML